MNEWVDVSLAQVCARPQYGAIARGSDEPVGPRFVRQTDIVTGRIDWSSVPFCDLPEAEVPKYAIQRGDLLVSRLGAGVGTAATVRESRGAVFAGYLVRFQADLQLALPDYLGYQLHTQAWRNHVTGFRSGAAQPTLNAQQMGAFRFQLPPINEQRRIVAVLGALDDLIESNSRLLIHLSTLQLAAFADSWDGNSRVRLADVAAITMGQSPPGDTYNERGEGRPFYQGTRDFGWRYPSRRVWTTKPTRLAEAGDVLVAVRAPVGELNIATENIALGRGLGSIRAPNRQATLLQALQVDPSLWDMHQGTGTVFASINKGGMSDLSIPWVDDDELEKTLGTVDRAVLELSDESAGLVRLRDQLLPLLMSGKIRVSEDLRVA